MSVQEHFGNLLRDFVDRDGRHIRQLSAATGGLGGDCVPHNTINRWFTAPNVKPRHWVDVAKVAWALHLNEEEANRLLQAGGHDKISDLRKQDIKPLERELLARWLKPSAASDPTAPPFQMPPDNPFFAGRGDLLSELRAALRNETGNACCLKGMPGSGKSSIAIRVAYQLKSHFKDGILWAQVDRSDTLSILSSFAEAYGRDVSRYGDIDSRAAKVRELLADKQALLILDNAPHDEALRPLLPPTGPCRVLVTTRSHELACMDSARHFDVLPFDNAKGESLALFRKILGDARVEREQKALESIADLLGHLPLALTIAANRLNTLSLTAVDFLKRINQEQQRLKELVRGDLNVRTVFGLSFAALPLHLQTLFTLLGVFAGVDFGAEAVAALAQLSLEEAESSLQQLCALSLVQAGKESGRYTLHPLLRDYSREQATDPTLPKQMAAYYSTFIRQHANDHADLDKEISNLFAACAIPTMPDFVATILAFYPFLQTRGFYDKATEFLTMAQKLAQGVELTAVTLNLGRIANKRGKYPLAEKLYRQALKLAQQAADPELIATILTTLGALHHRRGQFAQANEAYTEALHFAQQSQNQQRMITILINQAVSTAVQGDYDNASRLYQQALELAERSQSAHHLISIYQNFGDLLGEQGNYGQAKTYFERGFTLAQELGDIELQSRLLGNLGLLSCGLANYVEANGYFNKGLQLAQSKGIALQICRQTANLGLAAAGRRQYELAEQQYQAALSQARDLDLPEDIAYILNGLGECLLEQSKWSPAEELFREAHQLAQTNHLLNENAKGLYGLARVSAAQGHISEAIQIGQESVLIFSQLQHKKANEVASWLQEITDLGGLNAPKSAV